MKVLNLPLNWQLFSLVLCSGLLARPPLPPLSPLSLPPPPPGCMPFLPPMLVLHQGLPGDAEFLHMQPRSEKNNPLWSKCLTTWEEWIDKGTLLSLFRRMCSEGCFPKHISSGSSASYGATYFSYLCPVDNSSLFLNLPFSLLCSPWPSIQPSGSYVSIGTYAET